MDEVIIETVEDNMVLALQATGQFKTVQSIGRNAIPNTLSYPAAFVFFVADTDTGNRPRPILDNAFHVVITAKNLRGENEASRNIYRLKESARTALSGKTFGIKTAGPLDYKGSRLVGYDAGVITYAMHFMTRLFMPVPENK